MENTNRIFQTQTHRKNKSEFKEIISLNQING